MHQEETARQTDQQGQGDGDREKDFNDADVQFRQWKDGKERQTAEKVRLSEHIFLCFVSVGQFPSKCQNVCAV